jgi:hypothetical protein
MTSRLKKLRKDSGLGRTLTLYTRLNLHWTGQMLIAIGWVLVGEAFVLTAGLPRC